MNWHDYGISLARTIANKSKDPNTRVGCVILGKDHEVLGTGYNAFPKGVNEPSSRWSRPEKYDYVVHAEANAIVLSRRDLRDSTLYCTHSPCKECTKLIIQAGIKRIVVDADAPITNMQQNEGVASVEMRQEANVLLEHCKVFNLENYQEPCIFF